MTSTANPGAAASASSARNAARHGTTFFEAIVHSPFRGGSGTPAWQKDRHGWQPFCQSGNARRFFGIAIFARRSFPLVRRDPEEGPLQPVLPPDRTGPTD